MNRINLVSVAAMLMTLGLAATAAETSRLTADPAGLGYVSTRVQLSQAQPAPGQPAPGTTQPAPSAAGGMMGQGMMGRGMMGMGQGGMGRMMGMDMMGTGAPVPGQPMAGPRAMGPGAMGPGAMGPGAMGMGRGPMAGPMAAEPIDRIEGRIAFLRAELKITEAQTVAWNEFAEAVRAGARRHNEMREQMKAVPAGPVGMSARLEQHERMLNGRLESTRTIRASLGRLQAVLTEDQRRTLDELMTVL